MYQWLSTPTLDSAPITLVEIPRCEEGELPISASLVRNLLFQSRWEDIRQIVPPTTYDYLRELFSEETSVYQTRRRQAIERQSAAAA
jgi:[citrate (pro-3S)-lyase] ligase